DGIRDFHVTGVQTCALPISSLPMPSGSVPSVLAGASASSAQPTAKVDRPRASTTSSARDRAIRGRWGEDNTVTSNRVRPLPERGLRLRRGSPHRYPGNRTAAPARRSRGRGGLVLET